MRVARGGDTLGFKITVVTEKNMLVPEQSLATYFSFPKGLTRQFWGRAERFFLAHAVAVPVLDAWR